MTTEQKERDAGEALDADVSLALGLVTLDRQSPIHWTTRNGETFGRKTPPRYSTDIADAFLVVEAMAKRGWKIDVQNRYEGCYACHVTFPADVSYGRIFEKATAFSDGTGSAGALAALAICRAAMAAFDLLASPAKSAVQETETPVSPASL